MGKIGDLCPLFFHPIKDEFGIESDYIQTFYISDSIILQYLSETSESPESYLINLSDGSSTRLSWSVYKHNDSVYCHYLRLTPAEGIYSVSVDGDESEPFEVTSDASLLDRTMLVEYSHHDNNSPFDNIFWIFNKDNEVVEHFVFVWRIEAGFKPSGYAAHVDAESYRNQYQEVRHLYSMPYDSYTLTVGGACGVPYWYVKHLNKLFCLSNVWLDGVLYVRSDANVPEMTQVLEGLSMFNASMVLERQVNEVSGVGGLAQEARTSSVVAFSLSDVKDGQMLQYSKGSDAFVNVTTVEI